MALRKSWYRFLCCAIGLAWGTAAWHAAGNAAQDQAPPNTATCDWSAARKLADPIRYVRIQRAAPRPLVVHAVQIDTNVDGIGFQSTPRRPGWTAGREETDRQTTRAFLRAARQQGQPVVVAVNGDAFAPWPAPFHQSTPTDLQGLAICEGDFVSAATGTPSLLVRASSPAPDAADREVARWQLSIENTAAGGQWEGIHTAISGFALCLDDGRPLPGQADLHPRTGIGLSRDGRWLYLVVIDGRQPASRGATVTELGEWLRYCGAERGINMDGGGSTTLAWWDETAPPAQACRLLNSPVGSGGNFSAWPPAWFVPSERANGNNLGIRWQPAER